jgi:hypothetical protein
MSKLHEVLAVESSLSAVSIKLVKESIKSLNKDNLFTGEVKSHSIFSETEQHLVQAPQVRSVTTTVEENLRYVFEEGLTPYWDSVYQKDEANQRAVADIIIGDYGVLAENVPGTTLLGMESKLGGLLEMLTAVPTLPPGVSWEQDPAQAKGIYRNPVAEERMQSVKIPDHKVLYEATDKHPAQIEKFETIQHVGKFTVKSFSGMISPNEKAELIKRLQVLISAVKQARQRANCVEVKDVHIGKLLTDYLLGSK